MTKNTTHIFQFKIKLKRIKPMIWRRIQVPSSCTFGQLHDFILAAMGWSGGHLHEFVMMHPKYYEHVHIGAVNDFSGTGDKVINEDKTRINRYFSLTNTKALYTYDFGDDWEHEIVLEKILKPLEGVSYPLCLDGKRACPPDDCGGVWGYQNLLEILSDPTHEEYDEMLEWCGHPIDPEEFDPQTIHFYE